MSHIPPRLLAALERAQDRVLGRQEPMEQAFGAEWDIFSECPDCLDMMPCAKCSEPEGKVS